MADSLVGPLVLTDKAGTLQGAAALRKDGNRHRNYFSRQPDGKRKIARICRGRSLRYERTRIPNSRDPALSVGAGHLGTLRSTGHANGRHHEYGIGQHRRNQNALRILRRTTRATIIVSNRSPAAAGYLMP